MEKLGKSKEFNYFMKEGKNVIDLITDKSGIGEKKLSLVELHAVLENLVSRVRLFCSRYVVKIQV